ncbi:MAG: hypothetical protein J6127_03395 [Clostridiales bacterium]|nr:hypothetical protein [Clostridiales bacterium]
MDKKVNASQLLRSLSEVDDIYINEAMTELNEPVKLKSGMNRAKVTRIMGIVAAAAVVLVTSYLLLRSFGKNSNTMQTTDAPVAEAEMAAGDLRERNGSASFSAEAASGAEPEEAEEMTDGLTYDATPAENLEVDMVVPFDVDITNPVEEYDSLDELSSATGVDISVPDQVGSSVERRFFAYDLRIIEVRYLDDEGNVVCAIRKAEDLYVDISGDNECVSEILKLDLEGLDNVRVYGGTDRFTAARWTSDGNSYSIVCEPLSEADITELILSVD